uniref:hypothetical protein n=1 Tax=Trichocoleus desertorum TaxID=1481672 RepID=UPI0025B3B44E|nr:hypothetical protein [Trichocoleus desertorum]
MNPVIEFSYRGWLIRVSLDEAGWSAKTKHPQHQQFNTIVGAFASAADAIQAGVNYVTWTNPSRTMQQLLRELRDSHHLNQQEYQHLCVSFEKGMQRLLPLRTKQEYES